MAYFKPSAGALALMVLVLLNLYRALRRAGAWRGCFCLSSRNGRTRFSA